MIAALDWGTELWDQFDNLTRYTDRGASLCDSLENFFRERCTIEQEYAKNLRRLARSVLPVKKRNADDFYQSLSFSRALQRVVQEHEDIAGQHELIAEHIRERVIGDIQSLGKLIREQRRRSCEENSRCRKVLEKASESMNKALRRYEDTFDVAKKASDAYQKANEDINLSRAQVEKARIAMVEKNSVCEFAKKEYHGQVEQYNESKNQYYEVEAPRVFKELQNFEETRVNRVKSCLTAYVQCHDEVIPRIQCCLDEMNKAAAAIDFPSDSRKIVDFFHSGYNLPADEVPIDFQLSDESSSRLSCEPTPRSLQSLHSSTLLRSSKRSKLGTILRVKDILKGKKDSSFTYECVNTHEISRLPPAQRLKRHRSVLESLEQQLATKQMERQGLVKMQRIYTENPRFGEGNAVNEKIKQTDYMIFSLTKEIHQQEQIINELMENLSLSKVSVDRWNNSDSQLSMNDIHQQSVDVSTIISNQSVQLPQRRDDEVNESKFISETPDSSKPESNGRTTAPALGTAIANYDFSGRGFGEGIISMQAGDELIVLELDTGDGWTKIQQKDGTVGFVPTSYCVMRLNGP